MNRILRASRDVRASDVHVRSDLPVFFRQNGVLKAQEEFRMSMDEVRAFIDSTIPEAFMSEWIKNGQVNYSYKTPKRVQFRVNAFLQQRSPSIVLRHVEEHPPTLEALNHDPLIFRELCAHEYGLILVSGSVGSGKSSTLAAMLTHMNETQNRHIVTLEDPIEFTHKDQECIFNQREVGLDTPSFHSGLKSALRQDPDVILVGEIRERETAEMVLSAAETGHLALASVHATDAQQTVQRFVDFFPTAATDYISRMFSGVLQATLTQKLAMNADQTGRVPVVEILLVDNLTREIIGKKEFSKIPQIIEAGYQSGCKSFNDDLFRLLEDERITEEEALRLSPNREALKMRIKGIFISRGGIVS